MPHREEWGMINYGQRGPRGRMGISVKKMDVDSEGHLWSHFSDGRNEDLGILPSGLPGEPGQNGRIIDVIVNGESKVDSEGVAIIDVTPAISYTAGDNIDISVDNVISSPLLIDKELVVTENVGGYVTGDHIPADTPIRTIIETILCPEPRPEPPTSDLFYWGVWGSRTSGAPTGIVDTMASETIEPAVVQRDGIIKYFTTRKQYEIIAYPATMPDLVAVYENDLPFNLVNG